MMLGMFAAVMWLVRRGHAMSVRYFSDEGLVRNDGRSFAWADLSRVVDQPARPRYSLDEVWASNYHRVKTWAGQERLNNGRHPTAATPLVIYLKRLGAAGDARPYALLSQNGL